ncbi:MAG: flippase-like domain-containing protein, partial [Bdellovibrionales bacterium]|nr:flippase-like domain-containing protein [Bdellovibrionales bacterium]
NPKRLFMVLFLTTLVWVTNFVLYWVLLYLLNIEASLLLGTTVAVIIALAVAAPSAPGFVGVFQTACLASFALFTLPEEQAFVYSVITHIFQYIFFIAYGVFVLSKAGMKLNELRDRSEKSLESVV